MGIRLRASRLRRDRLRIFPARLILVGPGRIDPPEGCATMSLSPARPEADALPNIGNI